jgi:hypothetical protein
MRDNMIWEISMWQTKQTFIDRCVAKKNTSFFLGVKYLWH